MRIKAEPEDFEVVEIPSYEPSGVGDHLFVRFEKRGLTTKMATDAIGRALGASPRDIGVAGMKDRHAVTRQWMSVPYPVKATGLEDKALGLALDGIRILEAKRHGNKLKTGHLRANRFAIRIRDLADGEAAAIATRLAEAATRGVPNRFGEQRFGRDGDNARHALAWISGKTRPPRDKKRARFDWSAVQSMLFNEVLERRVADGTWGLCLPGDIAKKRDTGGLFEVGALSERESPALGRLMSESASVRSLAGEISPTGPIFGASMRATSGRPAEIEASVLADLTPGIDLAALRPLGEGTRRVLRIFPEEVSSTREEDGSLRVYFVLPTGAYATTVLASVTAQPADGRTPEGSVDEDIE